MADASPTPYDDDYTNRMIAALMNPAPLPSSAIPMMTLGKGPVNPTPIDPKVQQFINAVTGKPFSW